MSARNIVLSVPSTLRVGFDMLLPQIRRREKIFGDSFYICPLHMTKRKEGKC